LDHKLKYW